MLVENLNDELKIQTMNFGGDRRPYQGRGLEDDRGENGSEI